MKIFTKFYFLAIFIEAVKKYTQKASIRFIYKRNCQKYNKIGTCLAKIYSVYSPIHSLMRLSPHWYYIQVRKINESMIK